MLKLDLSGEEQGLLKKVCMLQISSLSMMLEQTAKVKLKIDRSSFQVTEKDIHEMLKHVVSLYHLVYQTPGDLFGEQHVLLPNFKDALENHFQALDPDSETYSHLLAKVHLALYIDEHVN